jgi:hypothetical protein
MGPQLYRLWPDFCRSLFVRYQLISPCFFVIWIVAALADVVLGSRREHARQLRLFSPAVLRAD